MAPIPTPNAPARLGIDPNPAVWPGATADELRVAPDGLPARVVKAHNVYKAHYISRYALTLATAMKNVFGERAYIDMYAGPGICWVQDTGEFVYGSPLIALAASPRFTRHVFVDMDPDCTAALHMRLAGSGAVILTANSNDPDTIAEVRRAIPRRGCLSLALLDPQGCTLHLETIRALTFDRRMDLLINFPVLNLYRNVAAGNTHKVDLVLDPDWPQDRPGYKGVDGWGAAARAHFRGKLAEFGYRYAEAREVRGVKTNGRLYDFMLASRNSLARKIFNDVTKVTPDGQMPLF